MRIIEAGIENLCFQSHLRSFFKIPFLLLLIGTAVEIIFA